MTFPGTTEKLTATPMANGNGYWVLTHLWNSDAFYAYPVTAAGIGAPVISHQGVVHTQVSSVHINNEAIGYMRISPDGSMVAVAIAPAISRVELFSFDNSTGKVTGLLFSHPYAWFGNGWGPYGISFSPNSKVLYATYEKSDTVTNYVIQYDLSQPSGQAMMNARDTFLVGGKYVGAAQIAPDGKIYIANASRNGSKVLERINNPDVVGPGCNYEHNAFTLTYGGLILGLPNDFDILPSRLTDSLVVIQGGCNDTCGNTVIAKAFLGHAPFTYHWSGNAQNDSVATKLCPGKYYVVINDSYGSSITDSITITLPEVLPVSISVNGDMLTCVNTGTVQWYLNNAAIAGAVSAGYIVPGPGNYTAAGLDAGGCPFSESVTIEPTNYFFPNAFTPNGDGVNDLFYPELQSGVVLLTFQVFDRWGELVYDDITRGWDGKYKGADAPAAVYTYRAAIQSLNGKVGPTKTKGSFTLIR